MDILSSIITAYLAVGKLVTTYVLIVFFITDYNVFDAPIKPDLTFSHKVSYVLVMLCLFPVFYGVFAKEILALKKIVVSDKTDEVAVIKNL